MQTVGEEGHPMYPLKDFGKLGHTNAINNKSRRPLDFLTTPSTPIKVYKNDCASMSGKLHQSNQQLAKERHENNFEIIHV